MAPASGGALLFELWGSGGGGTNGGNGAYVAGVIIANPGETFRGIVGFVNPNIQFAGSTSSFPDYLGCGGYSSTGLSGTSSHGNGGGRTALQRSVNGVWVEVLTAGGGGGTGDKSSPGGSAGLLSSAASASTTLGASSTINLDTVTCAAGTTYCSNQVSGTFGGGWSQGGGGGGACGGFAGTRSWPTGGAGTGGTSYIHSSFSCAVGIGGVIGTPSSSSATWDGTAGTPNNKGLLVMTVLPPLFSTTSCLLATPSTTAIPSLTPTPLSTSTPSVTPTFSSIPASLTQTQSPTASSTATTNTFQPNRPLGDTLNAGQCMSAGDNLLDKCGRYSLIMMPSGNLILFTTELYSYNSNNDFALYQNQWTAGTATPGSRACVFSSGIFAVVSPTNSVLWKVGLGSSPVSGSYTSASFSIQVDRNACLTLFQGSQSTICTWTQVYYNELSCPSLSTSSTPSSTITPTPSTTPPTLPSGAPAYTPASTPSTSVTETVTVTTSPSITPSTSPTPSQSPYFSTPTFGGGSGGGGPHAYCAPGQYYDNITSAPTQCSVGYYCPGGTSGQIACDPPTACSVSGLVAQPTCYWNVTILAGSGIAGFADGAGTSAMINWPERIAITAGGNYVIADAFNNCIRLVTPSGIVSTLAGGMPGYLDSVGTNAKFNHPFGVAVLADGSIAVADELNHRIRLISPALVVSTLAGSGTAAFANGVGILASFLNPQGLAVFSNGDLAVADTANNRIRVVTPSGSVSTLAGSGVATSINGIGTSASIERPNGITIDSNDNVIVPDYENRIRIVTRLGVVTTLAGSGTAMWLDGTGVSAAFNLPRSVAMDPSGNMIVADGGNNQLRRITPSGVVTTFAGSGVASSLDGFGTAATFNVPHGIAVTSNGVIIVGEEGGNYIRSLTCSPCPASYFCISGTPVICPAGSYCPFNSLNPIACPAGKRSAAIGAVSSVTCTACAAGSWSESGASTCTSCPSGMTSSSGSTSYSACTDQSGGGSGGGGSGGGGAPSLARPGASCSSDTSCPSGACRGGYCCSDSSAFLGCSTCSFQTGACLTVNPGDACSSPFDCASGACLGGCCCSASALMTVSCSACRCLSVNGTTASIAGKCTSSSMAIPPATEQTMASVPCDSSSDTQNSSVALSRVINFPPSAYVSGITPLVFIPATAPINTFGVDIIVASASACAAYANNGAKSSCSALTFVLPDGTYYYLGSALSLGMAAAPKCNLNASPLSPTPMPTLTPSASLTPSLPLTPLSTLTLTATSSATPASLTQPPSPSTTPPASPICSIRLSKDSSLGPYASDWEYSSYLTIAEVQAFSSRDGSGTNLILNKPCTASSSYVYSDGSNFVCGLAVDGDAGSFMSSSRSDSSPWLSIAATGIRSFGSISITPRNVLSTRTGGVMVSLLLSTTKEVLWSQQIPSVVTSSAPIIFNVNTDCESKVNPDPTPSPTSTSSLFPATPIASLSPTPTLSASACESASSSSTPSITPTPSSTLTHTSSSITCTASSCITPSICMGNVCVAASSYPSCATCMSTTYTVSSATNTYTSIVAPANGGALLFELWGAGGGGTNGGNGAYVAGVVVANPGEIFRGIVGFVNPNIQLAGSISSFPDYLGCGGYSSTGLSGTSSHGNGGGRTALQRSVNGVWEEVLTAGGGGGTGDKSSPGGSAGLLSSAASESTTLGASSTMNLDTVTCAAGTTYCANQVSGTFGGGWSQGGGGGGACGGFAGTRSWPNGGAGTGGTSYIHSSFSCAVGIGGVIGTPSPSSATWDGTAGTPNNKGLLVMTVLPPLFSTTSCLVMAPPSTTATPSQTPSVSATRSETLSITLIPTSPSPSSSLSSPPIACPAGQFVYSGVCYVCAQNTYSTGGTVTSCSVCGYGLSSPAGSISSSACVSSGCAASSVRVSTRDKVQLRIAELYVRDRTGSNVAKSCTATSSSYYTDQYGGPWGPWNAFKGDYDQSYNGFVSSPTDSSPWLRGSWLSQKMVASIEFTTYFGDPHGVMQIELLDSSGTTVMSYNYKGALNGGTSTFLSLTGCSVSSSVTGSIVGVGTGVFWIPDIFPATYNYVSDCNLCNNYNPNFCGTDLMPLGANYLDGKSEGPFFACTMFVAAPPIPALTSLTFNIAITDGSFETAVVGTANFGILDPTISGWQIGDNTTDIQPLIANGISAYSNPAPINGNQCLVIQTSSTSVIQQTVLLPAVTGAAWITISYWHAKRVATAAGGHVLSVTFGGTLVDSFIVPQTSAWTQRSVSFPVPSSGGPAVLQFQVVNLHPADESSFLDAVTVTMQVAGVIVTTGAFTSCSGGQYLYTGWCFQCAANSFSAEGATTCTTCADGTTSAAGSLSCTACSAGSYRSSSMAACVQCAAGTYSATSATSCIQCPSGQISPSGSTQISACVPIPVYVCGTSSTAVFESTLTLAVTASSSYNNYANCALTVSVTVPRTVMLTFSSFRTESTYDFLWVTTLEGWSSLHWSGSLTPAALTLPASASYTFHFTSDGSLFYQGASFALTNAD